MKSASMQSPNTKQQASINMLMMPAMRSSLVLAVLISFALLAVAVTANNHARVKDERPTEGSAISKPTLSSTPVFNPGPSSNSTGAASSFTPVSSGRQNEPSAPLRAVHFRITALGIEPAEQTLPSGRYLVAVDNDSGFNEVDIRIDRKGGPQVARSQLPIGRRKVRLFIDLTPGRYVLTDPGDSKRVSSFTVTN